MGQPLRLDRRVPFVDAVFRVIDDGAPLSLAVDALVAAETAAGVAIVGGPLLTWIDEVLTLDAAVPTPALPELARLCAVSRAPSERPFAPELAEMEAFHGESLDRLLDHTHLFLTGEDFCNDYGLIAGRTVGSPGTWRSWSATVASWANRRGIARPSGIGGTQHSRAPMRRRYFVGAGAARAARNFCTAALSFLPAVCQRKRPSTASTLVPMT